MTTSMNLGMFREKERTVTGTMYTSSRFVFVIVCNGSNINIFVIIIIPIAIIRIFITIQRQCQNIAIGSPEAWLFCFNRLKLD